MFFLKVKYYLLFVIKMDERTILCFLFLFILVSIANIFCTTICIILIAKHTSIMKDNICYKNEPMEPVIIQEEVLENIIVKYVREICMRSIQSIFMTMGNSMYSLHGNQYGNHHEIKN